MIFDLNLLIFNIFLLVVYFPDMDNVYFSVFKKLFSFEILSTEYDRYYRCI